MACESVGRSVVRLHNGLLAAARGLEVRVDDIDGRFQKRGRSAQQQADQRWSDASDEHGAPWGPADDAGANMGKQKQQEDNCRRDDVDSR